MAARSTFSALSLSKLLAVPLALGLLLAPGTSPAEQAADGDNRVRIVQLLQLARSHAPNAKPELERGLSDPSESVRIAAVSGLEALGDPSVVPALERRAELEASPSVKARIATAIGRLRKASLDSAKFVVQIGNMTNVTQVHNAELPGVMRAAARTHATHVKGAVVVEGPSDTLMQRAAEKHLPVLVLDGQLSKLNRADATGNVTFSAQVEFVVRKSPSQVLAGTFKGGAAGSDSTKALESQRRVQQLQGEVVSGAVESALRGAEHSLAEASR